MRRVYIYTGNHGHHPGITDPVMMLRNGARDCGYDAVVSHQPESGEWNILIENFGDERQVEFVRSKWTPGTRYIMLCTEALNGRFFNDGMTTGDSHYSNAAYWRARFEGFRRLVEHCEELWVLAESQLTAYRRVFPHKRIFLLPHGWVSGMNLVQHRPEAEKDLDFFFSGSITPYRLAILEKLQKNHRVAFSPQGGADYLRSDLLARSKVCLSIPLSPENVVPSVSRIHFHLQNSNFVLQHKYVESCELDPYVLHANANDFCEWARACLSLENRREIAEAAHARFRKELPMSRLMAPLLAGDGDGIDEGARLASDTLVERVSS
jgi:hypothetical protein